MPVGHPRTRLVAGISAFLTHNFLFAEELHFFCALFLRRPVVLAPIWI
jgi:hypothetical protein